MQPVSQQNCGTHPHRQQSAENQHRNFALLVNLVGLAADHQHAETAPAVGGLKDHVAVLFLGGLHYFFVGMLANAVHQITRQARLAGSVFQYLKIALCLLWS